MRLIYVPRACVCAHHNVQTLAISYYRATQPQSEEETESSVRGSKQPSRGCQNALMSPSLIEAIR